MLIGEAIFLATHLFFSVRSAARVTRSHMTKALRRVRKDGTV